MNYIKQLLATLLLLAACADVPDSGAVDVSADGGVEVESVEQASCLAPCQTVPHKIFLSLDYINANWVTGSSGGSNGVNTGVSSGWGNNWANYNLSSLQTILYRSYNSCTSDGVNANCDGVGIACPYYGLVHSSEASFGMYCGDAWGWAPYTVTCGTPGYLGTGSNYSWNPPGSRPLNNSWNLITPIQANAPGFMAVVNSPWGGKTVTCTYPVVNGWFGLLEQ